MENLWRIAWWELRPIWNYTGKVCPKSGRISMRFPSIYYLQKIKKLLFRRWKDQPFNHITFDSVLVLLLIYVISLSPDKKDIVFHNIFCHFPGIQKVNVFPWNLRSTSSILSPRLLNIYLSFTLSLASLGFFFFVKHLYLSDYNRISPLFMSNTNSFIFIMNLTKTNYFLENKKI